MNSFGRIFRISLYGESHGTEIGVIIDGCPPGINLTEKDFIKDIERRKSGIVGTTKRTESDKPIIKSGVYKNKTTGAPIMISFKNENQKSEDYEFDGFFRPGHADFTANKKYKGFNDYRGGGHFSGRLSLPVVAAGIVAKKIIPEINITAKIEEIGGQKNYIKLIEKTIKEKDSIGGIISCTVKNIPAGLGEPFFNSLESVISAGLFSIPGIKAVEFGAGINLSKMKGSEFNDVFIDTSGKTLTNNAGGINGGISNGNDIFFKVHIRPSSSIGKTLKTYNFKTNKMQNFSVKGRHDACFALRLPPVVEAVTAIVIADFWMGG